MWDKLKILREEFMNLRVMDAMDYEKFCMISIVWHSSRIEGCSLSETDTSGSKFRLFNYLYPAFVISSHAQPYQNKTFSLLGC